MRDPRGENYRLAMTQALNQQYMDQDCQDCEGTGRDCRGCPVYQARADADQFVQGADHE